MERLVTTTQAAQILGLSLQGIHYRIKKNQLKSIKQSGKIFVYISEKMERDSVFENTKNKETITSNNEKIESIVEVKNEQIHLLKKSLKWTKRQYESEIKRLEKNQDNLSDVFKSEIKLLQNAFNEMRSIYKPQIENKQENNPTDKFITLQNFTILMKKYNKSQDEIKLLILEAIKNSDDRFIYDKTNKKLLILNSDFKDLL